MADLDLATIGVAFDTSGLEKGTAAFKANEEAAARSAAAADKVSESSKKVSNTATQMMAAWEAAQRAARQQAEVQSVLTSSTDKLNLGQLKFIDQVRDQVAALGLSRAALVEQRAAQLGVSAALEQEIAALKRAEEQTHKFNLATAGTSRELMVLAHEAATGNFSRLGGSMMVLANQSGGAHIALQALRTPLGLAAAGFVALGAAVVAAGLYYEHHAQQLNVLEAQLAATGRASMVTRGELEAMTRSLDTLPDVSRAAAAEIIGSFTKQRQIGHDLMQSLIADVGDFAAATGEKAPEAAKHLASAFGDPAAGARKLHDELGILTQAEVDQIEHLTKMGDVSRAQDMLFAALHERIHGLNTAALGPLSQATKELREEWARLNDGTTHNPGLEAANHALAGIVGGLTWIIGHTKEAGDALTDFARNHPWLTSLMPGGGAMAAIIAGNSGKQTGGASGSWAPTSADVDSTKEWIDSITKANEQYKTQGHALLELRERQQTLINALDVANQKYGEGSRESAKLRVELAGVNETVAHARPNAEMLGAAMERLRAAEALSQAATQAEVAHIRSLERQGLLTEIQAIEQVSTAELKSLDVKHALIEQELALTKTQKERQAVLGKLAEADQQYQIAQRTGADKVAEYWSKSFRAFEEGSAKEIDATNNSTEALRKRIEAIRLEVEGNESSAQAINAVALARMQDFAAANASTIQDAAQWKAIMDQIAAYKELGDWLDKLQSKRLTDKAAQEAERAWKHTANTIENDLEGAIVDGGGRGAKRLFEDMKRWAAHLVLQPILSPISSGISSLLNPGAPSAQAGGSALSSLGSLGGMVGGLGTFGAGMSAGFGGLTGSIGSLFTGVGFGTGTTLGGSISAGMIALQSGNIAGGLGTLAGALGPIAMGVGLLVSAIGKRGETRHGGQFANTDLLAAPSGGGYDAGIPAIQGAMQTINQLLRTMGSTQQLGTLYSGFEDSKNGKGFAYARGTLSGGAQFGNWMTDGYMQNRGSMTPEQAAQQFGVELKRATIAALQASDLKGVLADSIRALGDASTLTADAIDAALGRINKALQEKQTLDERLFEATHNAQEIRLHQQELERASLDESNRALYDQVVAAENAKAALQGANGELDSLATAADRVAALTKKMTPQLIGSFLGPEAGRQALIESITARLKEAGIPATVELIASATREQFMAVFQQLSAMGNANGLQAMLDVAQDFLGLTQPLADAAADAASRVRDLQQTLLDLGHGLSDYLRQLSADRAGTAAPWTRQALTKANAEADYTLAQGGDVDAYRRLQSSVQAAIEAQKGVTASGPETQAVIDNWIQRIGALPAVKSYEQQNVELLGNIITALNSLPESFVAKLSPVLAQNFDKIDTNQNGGLSFAELQAALAGKATDAQIQQMMYVLDSNGDGQISRLELLGGIGGQTNDKLNTLLTRIGTDSLLAYSASAVAGAYQAIIVNTGSTSQWGQAIYDRLGSMGGVGGTAAPPPVTAPIPTSGGVTTGGTGSTSGTVGGSGWSPGSTTTESGSITGGVSDQMRLIATTLAQYVDQYDSWGAINWARSQGISYETAVSSLSQIGLDAYAATFPHFAGGGDHLGGLRLVGEYGPELEATGPSRIFNADQTREILSGSRADMAGVEKRLDAMNEKLSMVIAVMAEGAREMIGVTKEAASATRSAAQEQQRNAARMPLSGIK